MSTDNQEVVGVEQGADQDFVPETQPVVVVENELAVNPGEVRARIKVLKEEIWKDYTELCKLLHTVQKKGLYEIWGYRTFREYASQELEFKATKAMYLAAIWQNLHEGQSPEVFEKVIKLGWSKAKELSRIVTKENVDEWVDKAKHLGVDALVKEVRKEISTRMPEEPREALDKEEENRGTPVENQPKSLTLQFDHEDYLTVMQATDQMQTDHPGTTIPRAVAMACREYLGSNVQGEGGRAATLRLIEHLSGLHNLTVVVQDADTKDFLLGHENAQQILKDVLASQSDALEEQAL